MMELTVSEIAAAVSGHLVAGNGNAAQPVCGIVWDSRQIAPDGAFLALPGARVDGNDFVVQAIRAGARAVICTREPDAAAREAAAGCGCALIVVEDGVAALTALASAWRARLSARVVGITGSTGKTSTKDLVASVLAQRYRTVATVANHNNELGVPATVLAAGPDTEALVVEMGMRGLGQIEALCKTVRPSFGIVTNIGSSHLELLGTRENIARAKSELLQALSDDGCAVLNADDSFTPFLVEQGRLAERGIAQCAFGLSAGADVRADAVSFDGRACASFRLSLPDGSTGTVHLSMPGRHNVYNALAAAALGQRLGLGIEEISRGLSQARGSGMRLEVVQLADGVTVVNDAYNANPDSMRAALETLAGMGTSGRRIAVLGDMGELGANEETLHEEVGTAAAASGVDLLVCVGALARAIAQGALAAGMAPDAVLVCDDAHEAARLVGSRAAAGDVVLVKASRFMGLEQVVREMAE